MNQLIKTQYQCNISHYKHHSRVKYLMYNHDSSMNSGSRAMPSSRLSTLVCLRWESGASCDTPLFDTRVRPEVQLCLMSGRFPFQSCAPTRFVPRWHSIASSPEAPCMNLGAHKKAWLRSCMTEITLNLICST